VAPALQGFPVAWFSPDYKSLLEVWYTLKRTLAPIISRSDFSQKRMELMTGGVIEMWSLDGDPECSRGRKYKRVIVNEAAKVKHLQVAWEMAIRPNLADFRGDAFFPSTPRGRDFYWELWQRGNADNPARSEQWMSWQKPTSDNPYINPAEIEDMRRDMPARAFSQEIEAQFLEVGGRFFDEWAEDTHVVQDKDIPAHWFKWGSLDGGTAAPFSFHIHAADEEGNVHTFGEVYQAGLLPLAQSVLVVALLRAKGIPLEGFDIAADSAMFPPRDPAERRGEYQIEAFWQAGLNCVRAVKNRVPGWTRMKEYVHKPGAWQVHRGACPNLIRTLPLMVYDERPGHEEDMDTTLEDHASDDVRYGFMTRPPMTPALLIEKTAEEIDAELAAVYRARLVARLVGHKVETEEWSL